MINYLSQRATCRSFKKEDIKNHTIEELIEAASHAPTTGNMQLYSVIITRDIDKKAQLAPAHFSQPAYMNAPVILTFCADFNRFVHWCEVSNAKPGFNNMQSLIAAILDTTILAQQFVTLAELQGIGTCYFGTTTYNADKIADILNLPKLVVPVITLAIGYPEGDCNPSDRLPVHSFLHNESYPQRSDMEIKAIYNYKEELPENKRFIKENNKESLAQVFTDIRYPKENNEIFSKAFVDFIQKQGFYLPYE